MAESPQDLGVGVGSGTADPLLGSTAAAASATLPSQEAVRQMAMQMIQNLAQSRQQGLGTGLIPGPTPTKPIMPQPPQQISPKGIIPQGPFGSVGERKRADTQAIFSNISDIVQGAQKKHYEMKVQKLQHDFETLSGAIQGYNEGKTTGNQEMMDHNVQIIRSITDDPKKSKELAKAFDVNLNPMAEGKGKGKEKPNPANDALKAAFVKDQQAFQSGQTKLSPQASAFMRAMPQTLQPDPRFQAYLEATKAGVFPKGGEELTFQKDLMEIQQRIQNNQFTNETREKIATMFTNARDRATQASLLRTAMMIGDSKNKMATLERMWANRSAKLLEGVKDRSQVMRDKIKTSGSTDDKKLSTLVNGLDKSASELNRQLEDARKAHDTQKMAQVTQQLESLEIMQRVANAEIARRLGMDPTSFDQEQFRLDEEMMRNYEALFPDAQGASGATPDQ